MQWKFYLDGVQKIEPQGWDEVTVAIERDPDIRGLIIRYTSELTWTGNGYDYIVNKISTAGFCTVVEVLIEVEQYPNNGYETFFEGIIFLSECEINRSWCTVKVKVRDAVWGAMIQNNKEIDAQLDVGRSKNDVAISATALTQIDFFRPSDGAVVYMNRECYKVGDVLKFLIHFMSDGTVEFISSLFTGAGEWANLVMCTGRAIRQTALASPPIIHFAETFTELHKRFNLAFAIEIIGGLPTVRIEYESYFYTATPLLSFRKIPDLIQKLNEDLLYAKLQIGSNTTQPSDGGTFKFPDIPFYGFKEESYHLVSSCNLNKTLDLVGDWIVDSNVIEDVAVNLNDQYDDDIFLVETDGTVAIEYTDFAPASVYNKNLTNRFIAPRFLGAIPASIASFLGNGDDGFEAEITPPISYNVGDTLEEEPYPFDVVISDPNGNYDGVTNFRYTAPADGFYKFRVFWDLQNIDFQGFTSGNLRIITKVKRYDVANVFIEAKTQTDDITPTVAAEIDFQPDGFYMVATDYVHVSFRAMQLGAGPDAITFDLVAGSSFSTVEVYSGGGIFQTYNPEDVKIYKFNFDNYPLSFADYKTLEANTYNSANINTGSDTAEDIEAYFDDVKYRPNGGDANFELFSNESGL